MHQSRYDEHKTCSKTPMLGSKSMCLICLNSDSSMKEDVNEGDVIGTPKNLRPLERVLNKACAMK